MVYHAWDLPVGQFFKAIKDKKRLDQSVPIVSPHMMLQKQYFKFGEPIFTTGLEVTDETFLKIRDQTERALNQAVEDLKTYRDSDPARFGPHPAVYALAGALLTYLVM